MQRTIRRLPLALLPLVLCAAAEVPAPGVPEPRAAAAAEADERAERLWTAAAQGDVETVRKLLDEGVDPDVMFRDTGTALMFAARRGHEEVTRLLLERGADVHRVDKLNNMTILHFGAGSPAILRLALEHGAVSDINQRETLFNHMPVWWAALQKCRECAEIMIATGKVSRAALEEAVPIALEVGQPEIAALLRAAAERTAEVAAWPQFRGPRASGVAEGANPPLSWSHQGPENVKWKTPIPGLGHSSPVVWGDRVFVTTAVSSQGKTDFHGGQVWDQATDMSSHAWKLYCLDRRTGKVLWERTAYQGEPRNRRHPKNSFASETPATDGKRVVAFFGSHGLHCYDMDGNLLWKQDFGALNTGWFFDAEVQWGSASSPILWRDLAIVQVDSQKGSFLAAFDVATGERRWLTPRDEWPSWGTPTIYEDASHLELITNGIKQVRSYDPLTGKELWHIKLGSSHISGATPVAGLGLIVVGNGHRPLKPLLAVRPGASGDISLGPDDTTNSSIVWSKKSAGPYYISPLIYGERLYVLSELGPLSVYYLKTGELIYRTRVGEGETFSASPVAAAGRLYLTGESGTVYVVDPGVEYKLLAVNTLGEGCMATPAVVERMMIFRTRSHLVAVEE